MMGFVKRYYGFVIFLGLLQYFVQSENVTAKHGTDEVEELISSTQQNIQKLLNIFNNNPDRTLAKSPKGSPHKTKHVSKNETKGKQSLATKSALQAAAKEGLNAMMKLYDKTEPDILKRGQLLQADHPGTLLSMFSAPVEDMENSTRAAYAILYATKKFHIRYKKEADLGRQAPHNKLSFRRTSLEAFCPPRDRPICMPAAQRYRTHDGTCNNQRRGRWGSAQMPFNRFLSPDYSDGIDAVRSSVEGGPLPSARFVSLLVHGSKDGESPVTLMLAQWGQLIDHDVTSTAQPRPLNGSVPRCCGPDDQHPSCLPIKVPLDDPWLASLNVRCLEFLRSAPAQRRDCTLTWREQTNQATSYLDASVVYSSSARVSDTARVFQKGLIIFGRGNPRQDVCLKAGVSASCIRAGDSRNGEQPGLLALHHAWVGEHNRLAIELSDLNPHWSDEKVYQEARRIVGAMIQHITYREFLPLVLGREVCRLFKLELQSTGYSDLYDVHVNPTVANSFSAAAFRFGHSLIQSSYLRCDRDHNFIDNNVTLHEEFARGDIGTPGSLNRLLRGLAVQRSLERDEFITPELTNHLFQTGNFPFGLDLAAINIQRGRDHGLPAYTQWREPCGLSPIDTWEDLESIMGPGSTRRISHAYRSVHDIDLFVGGMAERPVVGGLVGPTFACIIAQQFSNLRRGDRFWYENSGFESSFTPAQLQSIRKVSLAQVLCRTLGGGTLQPLVFLPHNVAGNDRLPCGTGGLAPIDLGPWQEEDFFQKMNEINIAQIAESLSFHIPKLNASLISKAPIKRVDFIPNSSIGVQPHQTSSNSSKVHDKLDFEASETSNSTEVKKPLQVNNNLKNKISSMKLDKLLLGGKHHRPGTRRTIIINNIPINLARRADDHKHNFTTKGNSQFIRTGKSIQSQLEDESDRNNETLPETKSAQREYDSHQVYGLVNRISKPPPKIVISTPDEQEYQIEINIRPSNTKKTRPPSYYHVPVPIATRPSSYHAITQAIPSRVPVRDTYAPNTQVPMRDPYSPPPQFSDVNSYLPPPRAPIQDNYISSSTPSYSPFSRPVPTISRPYQLSTYGTKTRPPHIIYVNHQDYETTTQRPNFLQTILTIGGGVSTGTKNTYSDNYYNNDIRPSILNSHDRYDTYASTSNSNGAGGSRITSVFNYSGSNRPNIEFTVSALNKRHSVDSFYGTNMTSLQSADRNLELVAIVPKPQVSPPQNSVYKTKIISQSSTTTTASYSTTQKPTLPPVIDITQRPNYQIQSTSLKHQITHTTKQPPMIYRPNSFGIHYEEAEIVNITQRPMYQVQTTPVYRKKEEKPKPPITPSIVAVAVPDKEQTPSYSTVLVTTNKYEEESEEIDDYYDEIDDSDLKIDHTEDIHVKPDHLILYLLNRELPEETQENKDNGLNNALNDDYVLPVLKETNVDGNITGPVETFNTAFEDTLARRSAIEVLAEDYDDTPSTSFSTINERFKEIIQNGTDNKPPAPIDRIESLEGQDHWILFDSEDEQAHQPIVPQLNYGRMATDEYPKPINISTTRKLVEDFLHHIELCDVKEQPANATDTLDPGQDSL